MFSLTEKRKHIRQVHTWNFDYNIVSTSNHSYLLLFHTQPIYKEAIVLKKCLTFTTLELNVGYAITLREISLYNEAIIFSCYKYKVHDSGSSTETI